MFPNHQGEVYHRLMNRLVERETREPLSKAEHEALPPFDEDDEHEIALKEFNRRMGEFARRDPDETPTLRRRR